jgi:hypothetical protein
MEFSARYLIRKHAVLVGLFIYCFINDGSYSRIFIFLIPFEDDIY